MVAFWSSDIRLDQRTPGGIYEGPVCHGGSGLGLGALLGSPRPPWAALGVKHGKNENGPLKKYENTSKSRALAIDRQDFV